LSFKPDTKNYANFDAVSFDEVQLAAVSYKKAQLTQREARDSLGI